MSSNKEDLKEKMHRFIDALIENSGGPDTPMTRMSMLFFEHFMGSQEILLRLYKEYADARIDKGDDVYEEDMKEMARKFLQAYLEFLELQRKNREKFKKAQSEIVKDYLDMVQDTLGYIHNEMSHPGASGPTN